MYQCRSCGGRLRFDIPSQQLKCEYCGTLYDPYSVEDGPAATEQSFYDVTVFSCPQCGGDRSRILQFLRCLNHFKPPSVQRTATGRSYSIFPDKGRLQEGLFRCIKTRFLCTKGIKG